MFAKSWIRLRLMLMKKVLVKNLKTFFNKFSGQHLLFTGAKFLGNIFLRNSRNWFVVLFGILWKANVKTNASLSEPSKSIIRYLTIVIWNLGKGKKQKLKITIFDGPLIVNQTFSQTKYLIGKSDFAHIMNFH